MWNDHSNEVIINRSLELLKKAADLLRRNHKIFKEFTCECSECKCVREIDEWLGDENS